MHYLALEELFESESSLYKNAVFWKNSEPMYNALRFKTNCTVSWSKDIRNASFICTTAAVSKHMICLSAMYTLKALIFNKYDKYDISNLPQNNPTDLIF